MSSTRPPNSTPGIGSATEPVARITAPASYVSPPTATLPSAVSEPSPAIVVILPLSQRKLTPLESDSETAARRACSASQSIAMSLVTIPSSAPSLASL